MVHPQQAINIVAALAGTGSLELLGGAPVPLDPRITDLLTVTIKNTSTGTDALVHFKIQVQVYPGGPFVDYLSDSDFGTGTNNMLFCSSGGLTTLAAGTTALLMIRTGPLYGVQFYAQGANTITITILGTVT